ncbi:MAG: HlyD family efflux transporter periplasmic adaptor subunit, partial [Anaerolineae bacterium]|nr:HlyD family efflux transporter periplasmic adaptor subunit [Anaerolineae bacterium]
AGAREQDITAAEAMVAEADAALKLAQSTLDNTELRAPFAGTVTQLTVGQGEMVTPGQAVLTLADLNSLQAETTDLSERDVARVAVGQPVNVYVEALNTDITGTVLRIASQANTVGGDVVYTVVVTLDEQPAGLRWGMSVDVDIDP